MTIITGANEPFFDSLINNLLSSVAVFEPTSFVYVWDLGLTDEQKKTLQEWYKYNHISGSIIDFPFDKLPAHFSMKCWNYAFKSYCIYNTIIKRETKYYLWLDAGCGIKKTLNPERNLLRLYGFYSPYSSTSISRYTHPTVMNAFGIDITKYDNNRMLSGGVVGCDISDISAFNLIVEWKNLAYNKDILAPQGCSLENHRYDQSLLSLCYYSRYSKVPLLANRLYNVAIHLNKG